jgi:hypothetical protein
MKCSWQVSVCEGRKLVGGVLSSDAVDKFGQTNDDVTGIRRKTHAEEIQQMSTEYYSETRRLENVDGK